MKRWMRRPSVRAGWSMPLVLSLAVATNILCFSLLQKGFFGPLPFRDGERLIAIGQGTASGAFGWGVYAGFADGLAGGVNGVQEVAGYSGPVPHGSFVLEDVGGQRWEPRGQFASHGLFPMLGIPPLLGRSFLAEEDQRGAAPVVMLGEAFWRSQFRADPSVIGRSVRLNHQPVTIIGVLPDYPVALLGAADVWTTKVGAMDETRNKVGHWTIPARLIARLQPGVTLKVLNRELQAYSSQLPYPFDLTKLMASDLVPLIAPMPGKAALSVLALTICFALISALNFGIVMLNGCMSRRQEVGVRLAIGGSHFSIARLVFAEVAWVLGTSLVLAIPWVWIAVGLVAPLSGLDSKAWWTAQLDMRTAGCLGLLMLVVAALASAAPILWIRRQSVTMLLGNRTAGGDLALAPARRVIIFLQTLAASFLFLAALVMADSLHSLRAIPLGFDPSVTVIELRLSPSAHETPASQTELGRRLLAAARLRGEILSAGVATAVPFSSTGLGGPMHVPTAEQGVPSNLTFVMGDYFKTMGIPVRPAQSETADGASTPWALVDEIAFLGNPPSRAVRFDHDYEVTGRVPRIHITRLEGEVEAQVYLPLSNQPMPSTSLFLVLRTTHRLPWTTLRDLVQETDQNVLDVRLVDLASAVDQVLVQRMAMLRLTLLLAALNIFAGGVGFLGAIHAAIRHLERDLAIRAVLGATTMRLTGPLWKQCGLPYLAGSLAGLSLAPFAFVSLVPEFPIPATSNLALAAIIFAFFAVLAVALFGLKMVRIFHGSSSAFLRG